MPVSDTGVTPLPRFRVLYLSIGSAFQALQLAETGLDDRAGTSTDRAESLYLLVRIAWEPAGDPPRRPAGEGLDAGRAPADGTGRPESAGALVDEAEKAGRWRC